MLNKLRRTLVFTNMLLVFIVLAVVLTSIVVINHQQSVREIRMSLEHAIRTSSQHYVIGAPPEEDAARPPADGGGGGSVQGDDMGDKPADTRRMILCAVYSLSDDGDLELISDGAVTISESNLASVASRMQQIEDGFGRLPDLGLYYVRQSDGDTTYIAFADSASADARIRTLVLTLLSAGILALGAFFVISIFLSRWALRPAERAWEQQARFIADASHELKTPLAVMMANNSIVMSHPEETVASQMQWMESSQSEARQMQELVADLLFLAKPENEEDRNLYADIDVSELVGRNLLQFEAVAFERGIMLDDDVDEGIFLHASDKRLQRLVGTLIDNACKYAGDGGTVDVQLHRSGKQVVFEVSNTGTPIAPEDLPHVFERFWRSDQARTRDDSGSYGLGLAIAKEVVTELGGTITATSDESRTVFRATIPAA